ncbi:YdiU family protein [Aliishimia ponticola]|uniref:Protein nucleotidyltransferase YdiU n=1 Tax=Aliishimia ponticola TaxID=2499833 RepID=A0A4S4NJJ0_9RHOB|nr:YdiU family protein [Aliishimia ponticola]THH38428.1 YdiU family protein [Aliishimia ponticola]
MSVHIPFDNSFARLPGAFFTAQSPVAVAEPGLIAFNHPLAEELGIRAASDTEIAQVFAGNALPEGAEPIAQLYAGHQFGSYNPQLGDGRAVLLGEVIDTNGLRRDIQLKGSGPTPYSRRGDGRAWLGPVLREYVVSEAMHALGVPTTRALAAVQTGEPVYRESIYPGAVLTRVAASHIRVGSFQVFAHRGQIDELRQLTDYTIARHAPGADGPMGLLRHVVAAQARLIAHWMSLGFIHGVMNTDNCTISGETIDYGPCAFMDDYHPGRVFSSIDQTGRYAYGNQPRIAIWNMAQFATALIQQMPDPQAAADEATQIVHDMPHLIERAWLQRFGAKIGLAAPSFDDVPLIEDLLTRMAANQADFTNTFRALAEGTGRDQFTDPAAFDAWERTWRDRLATETAPEDLMMRTNPAVIARNHRMEQMIAAAVAGDFAPFERLMRVLATPFSISAEDADLTRPPMPSEVVAATFCGT